MEPDAIHLLALSIFGTCMLGLGYLWGNRASKLRFVTVPDLRKAEAERDEHWRHVIASMTAPPPQTSWLKSNNPESPPPPASAEVETERRDREQAGPAACEDRPIDDAAFGAPGRVDQADYDFTIVVNIPTRVATRIPCATPFLNKHAPKFVAKAKTKKKGKK